MFQTKSFIPRRGLHLMSNTERVCTVEE